MDSIILIRLLGMIFSEGPGYLVPATEGGTTMDPTWIATIVSSIITGGVGFGGAIMLFKKNSGDDRQALIDQLQEERDVTQRQLREERQEFAKQLVEERAAAQEERLAYTARLDQMWADKAASREHVAALRDHIWSRQAPPPPDPPPGYIH